MNKEKVVWTKQKAAKSGVLFGLHFVFLVLIAFVLLLGDKLSSLAIEMRERGADYLYMVFCLFLLTIIAYMYFFFEGKHMLIHSPKNGIAFALSDDLKNWTEYGSTTLEQDQWPWANGRITAGFAMEAPRECGYRYLLFFHGSRNEYPETHGSASVAIAYTNDFIHFDTEL